MQVYCQGPAGFQSTLPREERRRTAKYIWWTAGKFQSTLPREERRISLLSCFSSVFYFNPRSHERSDYHEHPQHHHFQHFNPRSHERSDQSHLNLMYNLQSISIHAPTRGATKSAMILSTAKGFQSTLPREERRIPWICCKRSA